MEFGVDDLTKADLNIFSGGSGDGSILSFFDRTQTRIGKEVLKEMLNSPSCNLLELQERVSTIRFFIQHSIVFEIDKTELDFIEHYISQPFSVLGMNTLDAVVFRMKNILSPSSKFYVISRGIEYFRNLVNKLERFRDNVNTIPRPAFIQDVCDAIDRIIVNSGLKSTIHSTSLLSLPNTDHLIRKKLFQDMRLLLDLTYKLDAFFSLALVAKQKQLTFAELQEDATVFEVTGLFHPLVSQPVPNDLSLESSSSLCFLTGPNMAGKSTFLKSIGLAVYLSHVGFPVPCTRLKISLFGGLLSGINVSDNLVNGYSYYYNEIKRVQKAISVIKQQGSCFVIFDELFKGTNVKDSFDATLLVTAGFSRVRKSLFVISSHIIEVANELGKEDSVIFKCFTGSIDNDSIQFSYKLKDGTSPERLGLALLERENVVFQLKEIEG